MVKLSTRTTNLIGAAACTLLLVYAYYLQHFGGLEPCPLCIFQRVAVFVLGLAFLIAAIHGPSHIGARVYAALIGLVALAGIGLAGRHLYIQSQSEGSVPACGATLDFMLDVFPLTDVIRQVLTGSGECAKVDWSLLGLSMPAWVLMAFMALGSFGVVKNWQHGPRGQE